MPSSTDATTLDVTVVLPVHNEAGHLIAELDRVEKAMADSHYSWEIVIIDDGSTDGSADLLTGRLTPDSQLEGAVRLIKFPVNRGSGSARRAGTIAARGRIVVWTDVDMTYPNDQIPWLVDQLGSNDQVVGARRTEEGTLKLIRKPAKWFIRKLASYLMERPIPDLNSGFRAFRRSASLPYLSQLPPGFSCVTTLTMSFMANGLFVHYVPIDYAARAGTSKFHWWRDTKRYLIQVIRMVLSYNPLRVFLPLGVLLMTTGFGKLIFDLFDKSGRIATNTIVVIVAAFQVLMTGLLADLVVRATRPRVDLTA